MTSDRALAPGSPGLGDAVAPGAARELASYLSRTQLERLLRCGAPRSEPADETLAGAMLFLDAVGFTALTERFAGSGRIGAEQAADVLRAYVQPVLELIENHGGDVLHFAGDALLVFWPSAEGAPDRQDAVTRAAACALAIQRCARSITAPHGARLTFRASLGAGVVRALEVGGVNGRWLQLVAGEPLEQIRAGDRVGTPGSVVLADPMLHALRDAAPHARPLGDGWSELTAIGAAVATTVRPEPVAPAWLDPILRAYVPRAVARGGAANSADMLAEFRRVTVVIANLAPARRSPAHPYDLALLHRAVQAAQEEVHRFDGEIDQLLEADKGTQLIVAFGLPGSAHAEDPVRAVRAARAVDARLRALGLAPAIGIATGTVFCGIHGAPHRRHYSLLGSTVNLAARLSDASGAGVLCDEATRTAAARRVTFTDVGATELKGFDGPVSMFAVGRTLAEAAPASRAVTLVGRERQLGQLDEALRELVTGRRGGVVIIEGDAGLGKSALLDSMLEQAPGAGAAVLRGFADPLERGTAYFAFRPVVRVWFGITPELDRGAARARVLDMLRDSPDFLPLAPLLGSILPLDLPDSELTAQMRGQVRAENLQRLLAHVAGVQRTGLHVLALEDVHWMDSASWSLLLTLARVSEGVLFVLSSRPVEQTAAEYDELRRREEILLIDLPPLTLGDTAAIMREQLGATDIADDVTALVGARAEGNPFFAQEIVRSLRESGAVRVVGGRCERADRAAVDALPSTLEGVITARIDRLTGPAQLTLKLAAVLGRAFHRELLRAVHPAAPSHLELEAQLALLRDAELIVPAADSAESTHRFQHALTQEAAYGLLPFSQRRAWHCGAGEALERLHAGFVAPVHARIAHHFRRAELPGRAIPHLVGAGRQALDTYACREAVEFLRDALTLDVHVRGDLHTDVQRAEWSRLAAQASYSLNAWDDARDGYERAVRYAGWSPPSGAAGALRALARLLGDRVRGRRRGQRRDAAARTLELEAIRAMTELGTVYLWKGDQARWAHNALNMTRLADALGDTPESSFALIQFASLLTVIGWRRRADRESTRAVAMAEQSGDLSHIVSCNIGRGMIMTSQGRPLDGVAPLRRAHAVAEELRAGLWKHRSTFQLGEALLWLGRYEEAGRCYEEAAAVSISAEPHVTGFATAMCACTLLHRGRTLDALALLEGPACLPYVGESPAALSIVCAYGVLAEARLLAGDPGGALAAVRRAEAAITPADDGTAGFFISVIGHSAIARVCLELARGALPAAAAEIMMLLERTFARLRRIARIHPGARPRVLRLLAQFDLLRFRTLQARRKLTAALDAAEAARMPWEVAHAALALAQLADAGGRDALLARAGVAFAEMGIPMTSEIARTPATR